MHIFKRGNELHFVEILFLTFILIARERINERLCGEQATDSICIITVRTFFFLLRVSKASECASSTDFYGMGSCSKVSPNVHALPNSDGHKHILNIFAELGLIGLVLPDAGYHKSWLQ